MIITHILDTSALLAHYFKEAGAEIVNNLFIDGKNDIGLCVVSLPEFKTRLIESVTDLAEVERAFQIYVDELTVCLAVDRSIANRAIDLRASASQRLPLVDSLIAACAQHYQAKLVHRDPHMSGISHTKVKQICLPMK